MPEVTYVGPSQAVDVVLSSGSRVRVEQGKSLKCNEKEAASLLEQPGNWERKSASKPKVDKKDEVKDGD